MTTYIRKFNCAVCDGIVTFDDVAKTIICSGCSGVVENAEIDAKTLRLAFRKE